MTTVVRFVGVWETWGSTVETASSHTEEDARFTRYTADWEGESVYQVLQEEKGGDWNR